MAEKLKEEGNALFKAGEFLKAAGKYTLAIKEDPKNAVYYSNRCAAFIKLAKLQKALADADKCTELDPKWDKGYFRRGAVLEELKRSDEALEAFRIAAELNPSNEEAVERVRTLGKHLKKEAFKEAQQEKAKQAPGSKPRIVDDESYKASIPLSTTGAQLEYSEERVAAFEKEVIKNAIASYVASGKDYIAPTVYFLSGHADENGEWQMGEVSIKSAFDSPATHAGCLDFLRKYASDTASHASMAVVLKEDISFPQVWKTSKWPLGNARGFFLQLQSKGGDRRLYFVQHPKSSKLPYEPQPLDAGDFVLLPPLYR